MADGDLEARFKKAVWLIRNGPPIKDARATNQMKLQFYKYFKQATLGDVQGKQPWAAQLEARAKYDAWASVKGMSKEEAMQHYIELLEDPDVWENNPALQQYPGPQWM